MSKLGFPVFSLSAVIIRKKVKISFALSRLASDARPKRAGECCPVSTKQVIAFREKSEYDEPKESNPRSLNHEREANKHDRKTTQPDR